MLPPAVQRLVQLFTHLPSVGEKTAARFALHLATRDPEVARALGEALVEIAEASEKPLCDICSDTRRDGAQLCIVARIQDLMSIERSHAFRGHYFVLGKLLSPLEGIGADELPIAQLVDRIRNPPAAASPVAVREILLATPPSVDGEATALLLAQELEQIGVEITRIASGVPHGGDLEFADPVTIGRAIAGRRGVS